MVSTRVPKRDPRGVSFDFQKNSKGISFAVWFLYSLELDGLYWGKPCTLAARHRWFRICFNHQFLGLGGHLEFQVIKEELSRRYIAIYSSSIGYDSPWLHRHLVLKKHDDRWNHSISAEKNQHFSTQWCTVQNLNPLDSQLIPYGNYMEFPLWVISYIHFSWSRSCLRMDAAFHVFQQWNGGCEWIALAATRHPLSPRIDAFTAFLCLNWQCWKLRWEALEYGLLKSLTWRW